MTVVAASGCFDVLLPGHVEYLRQARLLGDMLVVLLASDERVTALKGEGYPLNSQWDRAMMLRELKCVDLVMPYQNCPGEVLASLKPAIYVKGPDYKGRLIPGEDVVNSYGGEVIVIEHEYKLHLSDIIDRHVQLQTN